MYSIVYVLVDDNRLDIYNEMMKSLTSLRMRMPECPVVVLTDQDTLEQLQCINAEVFQVANVIEVNFIGDYTQIEKSRYIKTQVRNLIKGDYLFVDTDTVICDVFPERISDSSIGLVLENHYPKSIAKSPYADIYDEICGIEKTDYDLYFNSGVMWVKDDSIAHDFYTKWHLKWEETRKSGLYRDQPSLNYVVRSMPSVVEVLDGTWNVQISTRIFAPIHLLVDAYIIHYMDNSWSPYQLCRPEYKCLEYNDAMILEMLKRPRTLFERCRVFRLNSNNEYDEGELKEYEQLKNSAQYRLLKRISSHNGLFQTNEKIITFVYRMLKRMKRREKKRYRHYL